MAVNDDVVYRLHCWKADTHNPYAYLYHCPNCAVDKLPLYREISSLTGFSCGELSLQVTSIPPNAPKVVTR